MKRRDLIRHLEHNGCEFLREGGNHTVYVNRRAQKSSAVPRHREIIEFIAQKDLQGFGYTQTVAAARECSPSQSKGELDSLPAVAKRRRVHEFLKEM